MNRLIITTILALLMNGCAVMNESFSCNETATDSCLTIDKVNAMTEPKGRFKKQSIFHQAKNTTSQNEVIWLSDNQVGVR